ncbi:MAG: hypothetical protein KDD69_19000 [Bdellovibrionales bacterium]|nr:hypothetical protein [Bdellovibrionales bacterium]
MSLETNKPALLHTGSVGAGEELDELANTIGEFVKYWGFKRIHGQIWTHLYLSAQPMDAGQLIRRLGVSKALISMSLSDLLSNDVILRAGKSSNGTQLYEANRKVVDVILQVLQQREANLIARVNEAQARLEAVSFEDTQRMGIDPKSVASLGRLVQTAQKSLATVLRLGSLDCSIWRKLGL